MVVNAAPAARRRQYFLFEGSRGERHNAANRRITLAENERRRQTGRSESFIRRQYVDRGPVGPTILAGYAPQPGVRGVQQGRDALGHWSCGLGRARPWSCHQVIEIESRFSASGFSREIRLLTSYVHRDFHCGLCGGGAGRVCRRFPAGRAQLQGPPAARTPLHRAEDRRSASPTRNWPCCATK